MFVTCPFKFLSVFLRFDAIRLSHFLVYLLSIVTPKIYALVLLNQVITLSTPSGRKANARFITHVTQLFFLEINLKLIYAVFLVTTTKIDVFWNVTPCSIRVTTFRVVLLHLLKWR
jgi:hypothetical protein